MLLHAARATDCDWTLMLDSDEELHNGEWLRPLLERWPYSTCPVVFEHFEGLPMRVGWKLLETRAWLCVARSHYWRHVKTGVTYNFVPEHVDGLLADALKQLPWLSHHPNRRTGLRARVRLGEHEHVIEAAPPDAVDFRLPPFANPVGWRTLRAVPDDERQAMTETAAFYCDQCGLRHLTPGVCTGRAESPHAAAVVVPLEETAASQMPAEAAVPPTGDSPFATMPRAVMFAEAKKRGLPVKATMSNAAVRALLETPAE